MPSAKSQPLSPAAMDLGLGGDLRQQLLDEEMQKKKKLLAQAQALGGSASPATMALFPNAGVNV